MSDNGDWSMKFVEYDLKIQILQIFILENLNSVAV